MTSAAPPLMQFAYLPLDDHERSTESEPKIWSHGVCPKAFSALDLKRLNRPYVHLNALSFARTQFASPRASS